MRRVAQVLYSGLGGHGSVACSLMDVARSVGDWNAQLIFFGAEPVIADYERICREFAIENQYVRTSTGRSWCAWPALYSALRKLQPDAIVLHSVKTILPCALYAKFHRVPIIAVEHQQNALKRRREWLVSRLAMQLADAVVLLTEDYREQLRQRLGRGWIEANVHLIPNGIDIHAFAPLESGRSGRPWVVGMAARMTSTKRQDLLVEAIALLVREDGPASWRLSVAGEGENNAALRERVRGLGLEESVDFPGYLDSDQLRQWFGSIDFYAHASEGETLSTSLLQAMAVGLPIVGSDVPGIANMLTSGKGVGLLAAQAPEAFAARLRQLASDSALAASLGQRARQYAVEQYSQESMFERYRSLVNQLCTE